MFAAPGHGAASATSMDSSPSAAPGQAYGGDHAETAAGELNAGSSARATVRVIYANATDASWEVITTDGVLVGGSTSVRLGNLQIIRDAANAIVAAGGPALTRQQIALFGGQS
jgi:hypothetical protein